MLATLLLSAVLAANAPALAVPPAAGILNSLRKEHPRLIGLPADLARVKKFIADDPQAAKLYATVKKQADKMLGEKPIEHRLIGPRLLDMSRRCLGRVYTLATVYRIGGDRRYADRAIREMRTAAAFPDWNPKHFLDTAEMTHALAIGYDWLYDALSPDDRRTIRRAIVDLGLRQAEPIYRKQTWWVTAHHNWNQVCNGGIALGALAVAEDEPELAANLLQQSVASIPRALAEYAPDGGWGEGPGYWNYATSYTVYYLAGLQSALGTDFGLAKMPGFAVTNDFRMHSVGPTKRCFNFADAHDGAGTAACSYWLARQFQRPGDAWFEREFIHGESAQHLWWYDPRGSLPDDLPTNRLFRHVGVAFFRSSWSDPQALYLAVKGGDNSVNHSHLQLGSFVLDAGGERFALQLGSDNYNLPGYFGKQRFTYYRLSTRGQNTLVIDGKNQDPKAVAAVTAYRSLPNHAHVVIDLSNAYAGQAGKILRGFALLNRTQVLVQDELSAVSGKQVVWQMHTRAEITLDGAAATLHQGSARLQARILAPGDATFATEPAAAPEPEAQQPDVQKLIVRLPGRQAPQTLAILFTPGEKTGETPNIVPLKMWSNEP